MEFWNKLIEKPMIAIVLIICLTILGVSIVVGIVEGSRQENEYRLKLHGR